MRWLFLNGSPRAGGNTAYALRRIRESCASDGDAVVERSLYASGIGPCVDCRACKAGNLTCPVADGMAGLYAELEGADLIVLGSPVYWSGVPGPVKNAIDRLRPYYKNGRLRGSRFLVVSVGASADCESDLIGAMYDRLFDALGSVSAGHVRINAFDEGDAERSGYDYSWIGKAVNPPSP
ncbi:MAG: flavodoxin family protein [Spirochaetes bacterium]|nr:flavodoxin family protein [Spirochaetota bacterium]